MHRDARTVSSTMRSTWFGFAALFIMVLLMLAQGQEPPSAPGKTHDISLHVFSSVITASWCGSLIMVCQWVCVIVWLLRAWHLWLSFGDLLLPWNCKPQTYRRSYISQSAPPLCCCSWRCLSTYSFVVFNRRFDPPVWGEACAFV